MKSKTRQITLKEKVFNTLVKINRPISTGDLAKSMKVKPNAISRSLSRLLTVDRFILQDCSRLPFLWSINPSERAVFKKYSTEKKQPILVPSMLHNQVRDFANKEKIYIQTAYKDILIQGLLTLNKSKEKQ